MPPLRRLRLQAGLTQEDLAAQAGVSIQTIYQLESGRRPARARTMKRIAQALSVPIADIVEFAERLRGDERAKE